MKIFLSLCNFLLYPCSIYWTEYLSILFTICYCFKLYQARKVNDHIVVCYGIHFVSFSVIFLDLRNVPTVWYFCLSFYHIWRYQRSHQKPQFEEERRIQWSKEKNQTMIYKTLFRKQKNKQHEIHKISGVNSGTPEGLVVPAPLVAPSPVMWPLL